jgi:hypothetical protein
MFDAGIGNVLISRRRKDDGLIAASVFLVDLLCLGVKNAVSHVVSPPRYEATLVALELVGDLMEIPPECARKLVEGAVAYAEDLGFSQHPDYRIAHQIFGHIDKTECETVLSSVPRGSLCIFQDLMRHQGILRESLTSWREDAVLAAFITQSWVWRKWKKFFSRMTSLMRKTRSCSSRPNIRRWRRWCRPVAGPSQG